MAQRWRPCKRRLFIHKLKRLGFGDLQHGARHDFMLTIPNNREYSVSQLRLLLRQIENILGHRIPLDEWNRL